MNRAHALARLADERFDVLVIGAGASGLGCALDAATRGYRTALIEQGDFASGTSSRSTKLAHGGVRYLRSGAFGLVREALRERERMRANAPELVRPISFFVPCGGAERMLYACGLRLYDRLGGASEFPRSELVPGGVRYWDAQFDDARFAVALAQTGWSAGAAIANYVRCEAFLYHGTRICGVRALERESGEPFEIRAAVTINAAGQFVDAVRRLDDSSAPPMLAHSRGSHVVVERACALPGGTDALLVPRTPDGRVLFAIPWHGRLLVGTTDVAVDAPDRSPHASESEISYLLSAVHSYLDAPIARDELVSQFAGIRPLLRGSAKSTARLSREHAVCVSRSGLVTLAGGKWTTYRRMAQQAVDVAAQSAQLPARACSTQRLRLRVDADRPLDLLPVHAAEHQMARTVEDVLARRSPLLFTDARAAQRAAPACARALASTLGRDATWAGEQTKHFFDVAAGCVPDSFTPGSKGAQR